MLSKMNTVAIGIALIITLGACTSKPIYSVTDAPITTAKPLQAGQVRTAIINSGVSLGWAMKEVKPGLLQGTLNLRGNTAVVDISYTTAKYSIQYNSSIGLNEGGGQIHKNYNGWIQNLDNKIRSELSRADLK